MGSGPRNFMDRLSDVDIEDLQYVEKDLCFYELVSLGFLLYGRERGHCEFILQKLIVLSQNPPKGKGNNQQGLPSVGTSNILRNYANINPSSWRVHIIEALAIIRAKRVLRKLGFYYQEIHDHYLPHIPEISLHIHPLLKALYKICERLTPAQAGRLITKINDTYLQHDAQNLRFYDSSYLEVFLLNWMTKRIISIGDQNLQQTNLQILIEYFKFNDLDSMKSILIDTINQNTKDECEPYVNDAAPSTSSIKVQANVESNTFKDSGAVMMSQDSMESIDCNSNEPELKVMPNSPQYEDEYDATERYIIRKERAGFILIINQSEFHEETDPTLRHLLPEKKFKPQRLGSDVDRDKLKSLFSSFSYTPQVFNNLTHNEMLHQIRQTTKKSLLRDSLIVCILSHGMEGVVYGCNSIPVKIEEIKNILTEGTLKGKPKLLIIQACQKYVSKLDTSVSDSMYAFTPDSHADMLLAMSSIPGTEALRHTIAGSWFIESLCNLTEKWGDRKHMLDILTAVTSDVSKKHGKDNEFMLPTTSTTLRKEFYLPSRKIRT